MSLAKILEDLSANVKEDISLMCIRREYVLTDALGVMKWSSFSCFKTIKVYSLMNCENLRFKIMLQVKFIGGEVGEDGGGPSREFCRLLGKDIQVSLCEGPTNRVTLRHDSLALRVRNVILTA